MKAAICSKYGSPDDLRIQHVEKPIPKDDEVLVKVMAATVNRTDCGILLAKPFFIRLFTGLFKPKHSVTGTDFAGEIESVGKNVSAFKAGDRVMGFNGMGAETHAEFVVLPAAKGISSMPDHLTYEQAVACLEGAFYAHSDMKFLKPGPGHKALVYGATGAIGSSLLQFLKYHGTYVTAVCGGENRALVASLGADKIIDYKTEDFTKDKERYNFVFDAVGGTSFFQCKKLLVEKGIFSWADGLHNMLLALVTPLFGGKKVIFNIPNDINGGISYIKGIIEKGGYRPIIDRTYPLDQIVEAFKYVLSKQKVGNVIITMNR